MGIKEDIIKINKELGGKLNRPGSLDFACDNIKNEKNVYKKSAYLIRAIAIDHPFDDFNKSTATIIVLREFKKKGIKINEEAFLRTIKNIVKKNIVDLKKIEKKLRKCCQKKK